MNKYEMVVIANAVLPQEEKEAVLREATEIISRNDGKIIQSQTWMDKQKISFVLKKATHGTYYLIQFESTGAAVNKIQQAFRMNEKILRFLVVKSD